MSRRDPLLRWTTIIEEKLNPLLKESYEKLILELATIHKGKTPKT